MLPPAVSVCHGVGAHRAAVFSVIWDYTQSRLILPSCLPEVAGALLVPLQSPKAGLGASKGLPGSPRTLCQWLGLLRLSAQPRRAEAGSFRLTWEAGSPWLGRLWGQPLSPRRRPDTCAVTTALAFGLLNTLSLH